MMIYLVSANTCCPGQMSVNVLTMRLKQHAATTVSCQYDSSRGPYTAPTQTPYE